MDKRFGRGFGGFVLTENLERQVIFYSIASHTNIYTNIYIYIYIYFLVYSILYLLSSIAADRMGWLQRCVVCFLKVNFFCDGSPSPLVETFSKQKREKKNASVNYFF